jgi:uncharacterized phage protein gp47/JayE
MAGLTITGFIAKTYSQIRASINTANQPVLGSGVETDQESLYAYLRNIVALEMETLWQANRSVVNQRGIQSAEGVQLDSEASVVGVKRQGSSNSAIEGVEVLGSEGSTIPQFYQMSDSETGEAFQTLQSYTLPASGSQPLLVDFQAINTGPIACLAGNLVGTFPSGVTSIDNPDDAILGTNAETDEEFRSAYSGRLAQIGGATLKAIEEAVRAVDNVSSVFVRDNRDGETDANGLPPYSFEVIVSGGTNSDIAQAILDKTAAGGPSFGNTTENAFYEGNSIPIKFSRPSDIDVFIEVDITSTDSNFPVGGGELIEDELLAYGATLSAGNDVLLAKLQNAVTSIDGILAYTLKFDTVDPPVNTASNISVDINERASISSARITITVS